MVGNRLVPLSSKEVFKILNREGFRQVKGGRGSHSRFEKIESSGRKTWWRVRRAARLNQT